MKITDKEIVLINPPQQNSLDDHLDPPLGLMYLAASLEKNNFGARIADLSSKPEESWSELIGNADIFGLTIFSSSFNVSKKISSIIRENNPKAKIFAGGPHPTALPELTLEGGHFDYVLKGEGEITFPKIIHKLSKGDLSSKIIQGERVTNLDELQFPARHLVDIKNYNRAVEGKSATTAMSSRGCPYTCSFCCKEVHMEQK